MKVKTADLIGPALDWAVAQCEGFKKIRAMPAWSNKHGVHGGPQVMVSNEEDSSFDYRPSTIWSQGGPIIEREHISVDNRKGDPCRAFKGTPAHYEFSMFAPEGQPLIAACRCLVASVLGDEVDVPEKLL